MALALPGISLGASDEDGTLIFRENLQQAPYIYRQDGNKSKLPQGYIPALLKYFIDDHGVEIDFVVIPRNRVPSSYQQKKLDASVLSEKWVENPNDFIFSQPVAEYRSVLIGDSSNGPDIINIADLKSAYICSRRGYVYPLLDQYWESNDLIRVDFADELLQLKGLEADRCQYAIMDHSVAKWYIRRHFKKSQFKVVGDEVTVPLTIGFRKDKADFAALFDTTISRLKANGELKILQRVFGVVGN